MRWRGETQLEQEGRQLVEPEELAAALQQQADLLRGKPLGSEVSMVVFCRDQRGMLVDVSSAVTAGATNILDVHTETRVPVRQRRWNASGT